MKFWFLGAVPFWFAGLAVLPGAVNAQEPILPEPGSVPSYLRDRGVGTPTSMFGTYVREGELLVYPFYEYYRNADEEYSPDEFGYGLDEDFTGKFTQSEWLIFLGYGLTANLALEFEAVLYTHRDIGRFIFRKQKHFLTSSNLGSAFNYNPVLSAMMVKLQRQRCALFNSNSLNLITITYVNTFVISPWPVNFQMTSVLLAIVVLKPCHQFFYVFGLILIYNKYGISGFNNDGVLHTYHC